MTEILLKVVLNAITITLNNSKLDNYVNCIYPTDVEINDTIDTTRSA
jgi:hypothetical protein